MVMKFVAYIDVEETGTKKFSYEANSPEEVWKEIAKEHDLKNVGLMTDGTTSYHLNSSKGSKLRSDVNFL
jgi:hypothetical protein